MALDYVTSKQVNVKTQTIPTLKTVPFNFVFFLLLALSVCIEGYSRSTPPPKTGLAILKIQQTTFPPPGDTSFIIMDD